jgi:hypothetical protein
MAETKVPPRPRGRPPVEDPGSPVTTWIPSREHDRLIRIAHAREVSVSSLVRELLRRQLPTKPRE